MTTASEASYLRGTAAASLPRTAATRGWRRRSVPTGGSSSSNVLDMVLHQLPGSGPRTGAPAGSPGILNSACHGDPEESVD